MTFKNIKKICKACVYLKGVYSLCLFHFLRSSLSTFRRSKSTNRDARCISASRACTPEREADQKLVHFRSMSSNPFSTRSIRFRAHFLATSSSHFWRIFFVVTIVLFNRSHIKLSWNCYRILCALVYNIQISC